MSSPLRIGTFFLETADQLQKLFPGPTLEDAYNNFEDTFVSNNIDMRVGCVAELVIALGGKVHPAVRRYVTPNAKSVNPDRVVKLTTKVMQKNCTSKQLRSLLQVIGTPISCEESDTAHPYTQLSRIAPPEPTSLAPLAGQTGGPHECFRVLLDYTRDKDKSKILKVMVNGLDDERKNKPLQIALIKIFASKPEIVPAVEVINLALVKGYVDLAFHFCTNGGEACNLDTLAILEDQDTATFERFVPYVDPKFANLIEGKNLDAEVQSVFSSNQVPHSLENLHPSKRSRSTPPRRPIIPEEMQPPQPSVSAEPYYFPESMIDDLQTGI